MSEQLPPPPLAGYEKWTDRVPTVPVDTSARRRPGVVTASGVLLLVSGAFSLLGGLILFDADGRPSLPGIETGRALAFVLLVTGGLYLIAGLLVLARSNAGRILALVLASIGLVGALSRFGSSPSSGLVSLAINGFIIFALVSCRDAFTAGRRR